jgi:hypothetical protein
MDALLKNFGAFLEKLSAFSGICVLETQRFLWDLCFGKLRRFCEKSGAAFQILGCLAKNLGALENIRAPYTSEKIRAPQRKSGCLRENQGTSSNIGAPSGAHPSKEGSAYCLAYLLR